MNIPSSEFNITQYTHLNYHGSFIISAFCGTGKTYFITNHPHLAIEYECWKYQTADFPHNYVHAIGQSIGMKRFIFISTNPISLYRLNAMGIPVIMILPKLSLKAEYLQRFLRRGSGVTFYQMLSKNWELWLTEAYSEPNNIHVILDSGEYVDDVLHPFIFRGLL